MISRCYLEITNICNLDCLFCPKTKRNKRRLTLEEFDTLSSKLEGKIQFLYFHLMGEPTLHPQLSDMVLVARDKGFKPVITTNGTLLNKADALIKAKPHKIQISLQANEGNGMQEVDAYMEEVMAFSKKASQEGIIVILRLWNQGGYETRNEQILNKIACFQPRPWIERHDGWKLAVNLYVEFDKMFEWPDEKYNVFADELNNVFCYALRNQIGVLVDGSVVPCCLDHDGDMVLGNLYNQTFDEIVTSPRARAIYDGFTNHKAVEPLCQRCGYAVKTKRFRQ